MRARIGALIRVARRVAWQSRDLAVLWVVLASVQPLLAPDNPLAAPDLMPWMALTLAAAVMLRGRSLGAGPHPMLVVRRTPLGHRMRALAGASAVLVLALVYQMARAPDVGSAGRAASAGVVLVAFLWWSRDEERTGWDPRPRRSSRWLPGVALSVLFCTAALALGGADVEGAELETAWAARSALLGLIFLAVGAVHGHPRNVYQRVVAGRSDGAGVSMDIFRPALAFFGPSAGLYLTFALAHAQLGELGYTQGFVVSLFALAWVGVLWPRRQPIAVPCLLHEIVPAGGKDQPAEATARGFERPPEGALRLNPLDIRRTRAMHPWLVPVHGARIRDLDDPVRALWARRALPTPAHILGEAAFEPDPITGGAQTEVLTLRVAQRSDMNTLRAGGAQSRRVSVLTAFPDLAAAQEERPTYEWDQELPPGSMQVLDAASELLELTNGAILVLSTEGVARAYELEIGEAILDRRALEHFRPPQLEDYVEVGG